MTDSPRYIVAKYISDLQRMEPKNIGVIVWTHDAVSARFAAERPDKPGEIDGRSIPIFVTSTAAYKQWVEFWRTALEAKPTRAGRTLQKWSDDLRQSSRGNFWLTDGGTILDNIRTEDIGNFTNDLFQRLVEPASDETRDVALDQVADDIIRRLRLTRNESFHTRYRVDCRVAPNVTEAFEFSHAYSNGSLKRLYQRVPLASKRTSLRRVVHDSAWMFEKVVDQNIVTRDQAVALVYATEERRRDPAVSWSFDVLSSVAQVANLADPNEAMAAFVVAQE
jgi:hypothetical protein